jgi:type IV secretion system protein VirB10
VGRALLFFLLAAPLAAIDADRDFSGRWVLDLDGSKLRALAMQPDQLLTVTQQDTRIQCAGTDAAGAVSNWELALDGSDTKYRIRGESMNSVVKWEGAALLINTLISGGRNSTIMDRWRLSRDHNSLTITRQIVSAGSQTEGALVYRREGYERTAAPQPRIEQQTLARRPDPPPPPAPGTEPTAPAVLTVKAGTRILMSLLNAVDTKHSREGNRIYLQTSFPVGVDGRIVIPQGSSVVGTLTKVKQPGHTSGKGEMYIRFDTLMLPNGVSRDFRSRPSSAEGAGQVDDKEGKISSDGPKTDTRHIAEGVGIGTTGGVIGGAAAGHPIAGAGIGAAAGLAAVLLTRDRSLVIPRGTSIEMTLDRDLTFNVTELR